MDKFKEGTVFEYSDEDYMILNHIEKEENAYLLVTPVFKEKGSVKTSYEQMMLIKVNLETDDMEIETNEEIVAEIVEDTMKKANI